MPQQVLATGECSEELVVEVIAVGEDYHRRVFRSRMPRDGSGVKAMLSLPSFSQILGYATRPDALVTKLTTGAVPIHHFTTRLL